MPRLPIPFQESYTSTRIGSDDQRTLNLYRHSTKGWRQFPGYTQFIDQAVTAPAIDQSTSIFTGGSGLALHSSGTKIYNVKKGAADYIQESTLSIPWDSSTAGTVTQTALTYIGAPGPQGLAFSAAGTKLYVSDSSGFIYQHSLTAWDTTTVAYDSVSLDVSSQGANLTGIAFNADGTRLYALDNLLMKVFQYNLSSGWDLSTASYSGFSRAIADTSARDIAISADGDRMWITGFDSSSLEEYVISEPSDVSSAFLLTTFDSSTQIDSNDIAIGIAWGNAGAKLYLLDDGDDLVHEYNASYTYGGNSRVARGMQVMDGVLYFVQDQTLYSSDSEANITTIGTIAGIARVVMETDGVQLMITTGTSGGTIYVYTVSGGLVTVTDPDVEDTAKSSAYLDLAFYLDQDDGNLIASANNDATSYSTDDKLEAESFADDILRTFAHNQLLYAFGQTSTEIYYTSGVGRPPIERQQVIERGIIGAHAVASIDDTIYFVDQFARPNMMSGLQYEPIYTPAIAEEWATYATVCDCIVTAYSFSQQTFVDFIFSSEDVAWTYHAQSRQWSRRQDVNGQRYRSVEYANIYSKTLALFNSNIWELSESTYQDNGESIIRTKDTELITSEIYGDASIYGKEMICNSLTLTTESTGAATLTISLAKDGGAFAQSRTMTLTAGTQVRELNAWGKFREGIFRITTTTNAGIDIVDVAGDFEVLDAS